MGRMLDGGEKLFQLILTRIPSKLRSPADLDRTQIIKSKDFTEIHKKVRGADREAHARTADTFFIKSVTGKLPLH